MNGKSAATVVKETSKQNAEVGENPPEDPEVIDLTALSDGSSDEEDDYDDSSEDEDPVIDGNSRQQLRAALTTVPATRLQEILMALVVQIPAVERALTKEFVGPKARVLKRHREEEEGREIVGEKMTRCTKCHAEYDAAAEHRDDECDLKPNYDAFVDWDEDVHGTIDSEEIRRQYPENYLWSCCEEDGRDPGCIKELHESINVKNKRRRTDEDWN